MRLTFSKGPHSMRPLTAEELYAALEETTTTSGVLNTTGVDVFRMNRRLLHCSRGLVEVTGAKQEESDGRILSSTDSLSTKADSGVLQPKLVVQFIHETVRSFLLRSNVADFTIAVAQSSRFHGTELQAVWSHATIAESCLQYIRGLNETAAFRTKTSTLRSIQILRGYSLAEYAASYWWRHARKTENASINHIVQVAFQLLTGSEARLVDWLYEGRSKWMPSLTPPLVYATHVGFPEPVSTILLSGADVNARGEDSETLLVTAIERGHDEIARMLVKAGAAVNKWSRYATPLSTAVEYRQEKIVKLLLDSHADPNAGHPLVGVTRAPSILRMILDAGADIDVHDTDGDTALSIAALSGHLPSLKLLLDRGASVDNVNFGYSSSTPLALASLNGYEEIVQALIGAGADVNRKNNAGDTALQEASWAGHHKVAQMLIRAGADANSCNNYGKSALWTASDLDSHETAQTLIDVGADINSQDNIEITPLQIATGERWS